MVGQDVDSQVEPQPGCVAADRGRADRAGDEARFALFLQHLFAKGLEHRIIGKRLQRQVLGDVRFFLYTVDAGRRGVDEPLDACRLRRPDQRPEGMEEGIVFEAMNLAAIKNLPVLFICENNGYSIHSPLPERSSALIISERVKAFGMEVSSTDGNDVLGVHDKLKDVVSRMRANPAPYFLEVMTYRICGHVGPENDDQYGYRPEAEIEEWRKRDSIEKLRKILKSSGASALVLDDIADEVDAEIRAAINAAMEAPFPDFDATMAFNLSVDYSPVATPLIEGPIGDFDPTQQETKPGPY